MDTNNTERIFEQKKCPKCGQTFVCSASVRCWCFEYDVTPENMEIIQETYDGCLCPECLKLYTRQA